jgi:hypothetical protein
MWEYSSKVRAVEENLLCGLFITRGSRYLSFEISHQFHTTDADRLRDGEFSFEKEDKRWLDIQIQNVGYVGEKGVNYF